MSQGEAVPSISLKYYTDVVRSKWWMLVVGTVLGLALAAGYLAVAPKVATATSAVSVNVISTDPFNASRSASGLIDIAGEAQVASSDAVARRVAEQLGGDYTGSSIRQATDVVAVGDTSILRISASASSEAEAVAMANAVASEFLAFRSEQAQTRIANTLDQSNERLDELRTELQDVDARIAAAEDGSRAQTQAETDRTLLNLQINSVLSQAASIESIDTTGGTVLNPADRNPVTWAPPRGMVLLSGAVAGFGAGLLGAFLVNVLGSRVRSANDISQNGGRTLLGELSHKEAALPPSGDDLAEYRAIRERLLATTHMGRRTGLLAVLDETGRGRNVDALNLAFVVALSGVQLEYVALGARGVDVDELIARLRLSKHPDQPDSGVRYRSDLAPSFRLFMPYPEDVPVADEPLSAPLRREIEALRGKMLVMFALSHESSEATRLAACRLADMAILLLARGGTKTSDLQQASTDVRSMGGQVVGSVLTHRHRMLATATRHADGQPTAAEEPMEPTTTPAGVRGGVEKAGSTTEG